MTTSDTPTTLDPAPLSTVPQDTLQPTAPDRAPDPTPDSTQWRAETFQVVNWGGFEGHTQFTLHPGATLISGASGTGKSTLLDGYIALLMPSDTPFNGASNDSGTGRARSTTQRNLLSYLRGQTDTITDHTGTERAKVLRGDRTPTWGAVAMTFVNDTHHRFTALRAYYVPARATRSTEITMRMATFDGRLNLTDLTVLTDDAFPPKALKATFPGLRTHDSYTSFANTLHTRLGIGAHGNGHKALRLLARIQAGHQIRTVDELYKELVLERPATYPAADRAIEHFDNLEASYLAMVTEEQKAQLLAHIHDRHNTLTAARDELVTLDTFGLSHGTNSPIGLWALRTERLLLDSAVTTNADERRRTHTELTAARDVENDLRHDLETAREAHRAGGGAQLEQLDEEITNTTTQRERRAERRTDLTDDLTTLNLTLDSPTAFTQAQQDATTFLNTYDTRTDELDTRRDTLKHQQHALLSTKATLTDQLTSYQNRTGRVTDTMDRLRHQAAAAAAMHPDELPYLAELVDIRPGHEQWRTAIETVLAASARLLLVPADQFEHFSTAIDPLQLRGRLTFQAAPHQNTAPPPPTDPNHIAGKLTYKTSSPFITWVHNHLTDPARNALCVPHTTALNGPGLRVTLAGQTRRGTRGAHGRGSTYDIIGFNNTEIRADLTRQLTATETALTDLDTQLAHLRDERLHLDRTRSAYHTLTVVRWDDIDTASLDRRLSDLHTAKDNILRSDNKLQALADRVQTLTTQLEQAQERRYTTTARMRALEDTFAELTDRQDAVTDQMDDIQDRQQVVLTDTQTARLDAELTAAADPNDPQSLPDFPTNLARLHARLTNAIDTARNEAERAEADLTKTFEAYKLTWDDPNLGTTVDSYPDYARILDNILTTGLHARRAEWRRRLTEWSGEDLVPLAGAMNEAVATIEERLQAINTILEDLPFGATHDRLRIHVRRLTPEHVTTFRRDLARLSSAATKDLPEAALATRFTHLQQFMNRIRHRDDTRTTDANDRDRLLDVRRHVHITAERYSPTGTLLATHSSLGGKSGGESQELVAFIVGAALRFRLGDDLRARPRFAPVFLDEGFIKSDAQFAGRAVQAWKGLGFQLIIGAPEDKVTALEPHVDTLVVITKNTTKGYSFVVPIPDTDRPQR